MDRAGGFLETHRLGQAARKIGFGRLDAIRVIGLGAVAAGPSRHALPGEGGFQHVGQKREYRFVDRQRVERLARGIFEPADEFAMSAKECRVARTRHEGEGTVRPVFDRGVELSGHFRQHVGRREKNCPAVAALGRMADAIRRILREKDGLIDVCRDLAAAEMLAEGSVPHEDDLVDVGELFTCGAAAVGVAAVIARARPACSGRAGDTR